MLTLAMTMKIRMMIMMMMMMMTTTTTMMMMMMKYGLSVNNYNHGDHARL
jgi:hypothetical protein